MEWFNLGLIPISMWVYDDVKNKWFSVSPYVLEDWLREAVAVSEERIGPKCAGGCERCGVAMCVFRHSTEEMGSTQVQH